MRKPRKTHAIKIMIKTADWTNKNLKGWKQNCFAKLNQKQKEKISEFFFQFQKKIKQL